MIGDEIPEGQGNVTHLLSECFELTTELRNDAEDNTSSPDQTPVSENGTEIVAT
jgi:hypothetical protein